MNPGLIEKASARLRKGFDARGRLTDFESQVMDDVRSAEYAQLQDDRFESSPGVADYTRGVLKDVTLEVASDLDDPMQSGNYAMRRLYGGLPSEHGETRDGPQVFPSQEAAAAHIRRSGFRDPGESVSQARARARQAAARPQNPRMGQTKRKHGGY